MNDVECGGVDWITHSRCVDLRVACCCEYNIEPFVEGREFRGQANGYQFSMTLTLGIRYSVWRFHISNETRHPVFFIVLCS